MKPFEIKDILDVLVEYDIRTFKCPGFEVSFGPSDYEENNPTEFDFEGLQFMDLTNDPE